MHVYHIACVFPHLSQLVIHARSVKHSAHFPTWDQLVIHARSSVVHRLREYSRIARSTFTFKLHLKFDFIELQF